VSEGPLEQREEGSGGRGLPIDGRWLGLAVGLVVLVLIALWAMFGPGQREADGTETWYYWLVWFIAPVGAGLGLYFAHRFYREVMEKDEGTERMREIAAAVRAGARAYIRRQYRVVAIVFAVLVVILGLMAFVFGAQSRLVPFAFLTSGFFSGLCGFLGMKTATYASGRTANAARQSLNGALRIAFRSGAVMGLVVAGFALMDVSVWFFVLNRVAPLFGQELTLSQITVIMMCFGMGASTQALFARVGGGIFTKAADVGADLVGKIEAGIPEDDPRNPATIADNVGDNVGDVAGMGADLYESYYNSILAAGALGVAAGLGFGGAIVPMMIAGVGTLLSIVGILAVRTREEASQKALLSGLNRGIWLTSALTLVGSFLIIWLVLRGRIGDQGAIGIWVAMLSGLVAGVFIGHWTERYTSDQYPATRKTAAQALTGPATVIIDGMASGMRSSGAPAVAISVAMLAAFYFAGGAHSISQGLFGVGLAAVGMLSTLGITLAADAYGPIADNAGGNAEMADLPPVVRERTDALDAVGNTTAATGKGFAIGSAALTVLALLAIYVEQVRTGLIRAGIPAMAGLSSWSEAGVADFMRYYNVTLMNPKVLTGLILGSMLAFVFCSMTLKAVGRAAGKMIDEVRRQFREMPGIMKGEQVPDYASCVDISTKAAQREMMVPALLAIVLPVAAGLVLGPAGVMGLISGGLVTGLVLAITLNNAGGAWDNAKKYIEKGNYGGKGSDAHTAAVVGDTVGDPFKDTSGPSLNILIKLISLVSVVFAGVVVRYSPWVMDKLGIGQ